ncbi:CDGSH iron-sulfur domain-containing protein [Streptomyces sp. 3MP-14]|uniref:CDGSH iron-sulfur domain-containing protein n=1 Tax=Streptomyces mimosae TaxID=2586635 RepID=A0A5N6A7H4_9ACTN|nr:CDGSH iron-sulfur domain-containing protein [Streptomyces mimosae]KAB8175342.1 CDGSH iron-sulfur domain-containing protein [Streptomyces sp. 3MP-14]
MERAGRGVADWSGERPRRVVAERDGPLLVEGPVEVVLDDGRVVRGDRFLVALCTCRRSRRFPWCDTSHRRRARADRADRADVDEAPEGER